MFVKGRKEMATIIVHGCVFQPRPHTVSFSRGKKNKGIRKKNPGHASVCQPVCMTTVIENAVEVQVF